jgi:hypothetical protein
MHDDRGSIGPIATLAIILLVICILIGAGIGWLVDGRLTIAVGLAACASVAALVAMLAIGIRLRLLTMRLHPPSWLDRLERQSSARPRYSDGALRAQELATAEARHFHHAHVGTEHLLLGLMRQGDNAARALARCGVTLEALIRAVDLIGGVGSDDAPDQVPLTLAARRALTSAEDAALAERAHVVGTSHLLLALASQHQQTAAAVLESLGCTQARLAEALRATRQRGED